eukprot:Gb_01794 [translate_table: standard]
MKSPPLQSAPRGYQMSVLDPFFLQGGTKSLGYGERLSGLCSIKEQFSGKNASFRCAMEMGGYPLEKSKKGTKVNNKVSGKTAGPSSASASPEEADNGDDDDEEEINDELSCFRGLVLDLSYRPVNVVCWRRAICLEFLEKADVLEYYDHTVSSPGGSFNIPAVLRVAKLVHVTQRRRFKAQLSRKNIYNRDLFTCQYCGARDNLTLDHILPVSHGGEWSWENLVTACFECNSRKGNKTLEEADMKLLRVPKVCQSSFVEFCIL